MWEIEKTVSRQIKNTQKLSESQKSARVLTPDSFHRGTSQRMDDRAARERDMQSPYWGLPCCLRCLLTPPGPIPLSPRNRSIQGTAEPRHHCLSGCTCTPDTNDARGSAHARAQRCPALLPAQRIAARSIALAETVERSSGTLVDQRRRQVLREPLGGSTTAPGGSRAAISKMNSVLAPADEWIQKVTTEQSGEA